MKRFLCILLVAGCLSSFVKAETYTLQQCIATAVQNNNELRRQDNRREAQQLAYNQARQNLLPYLNGSVGQSWVFGRSIGADNVYHSQNSSQTSFNLSAGLMLFDGLQMKFQIDQTRASLLSSEQDVKALEADITMNISAMYLQVLLCKELLAVAQNRLEDTTLKLEKTEALVSTGRMAQGEIYAIRAQQSKEQLSCTQAENDLRLALLDLAQAMELDDFLSFDIALPSDDELGERLLPSNDEVFAVALQNRPEIKAAEYSLQASESAVKAAKAAYSPTLSAGANLGTGYYNMNGAENEKFGKQLGDNLSTSVGLTLNVPVFTRMQTTNAVRQAKLDRENTRLQMEQVKKDLRKKIDQAYYNALAAQSRQHAAGQAEESGAEAYRYAEQKYESGRSSVYEYYEARNTYTQARSERLQAKYDYLFKLKILYYYQGLL